MRVCFVKWAYKYLVWYSTEECPSSNRSKCGSVIDHEENKK